MSVAAAWCTVTLGALSSAVLLAWVALTASGLLDKRSLTWWWMQ